MISFLSNIRCMEKIKIKGMTVIFDSLKMIYYKTTIYYIEIILKLFLWVAVVILATLLSTKSLHLT